MVFARNLFCASSRKPSFITVCIRSATELPLPPAQKILSQISFNNFNEAEQIALNCLSQKPNIKEIGQIINFTEEKLFTNFSAVFC